MLGYDVEKLAVMHQPSSESGDSPTMQPKKKRSCDCGSQEVFINTLSTILYKLIYDNEIFVIVLYWYLQDWEYLLNSLHHHSLGPGLSSLLGLKPVNSSSGGFEGDTARGQINTSALLFAYIPLVLFSLHLLFEVS